MTVLADKLSYLVNPVLTELGGKALTALSSSSTNKTEKMCALTLDGYVTQVLMAEPWTCVSKRDSALTASTETSDEFDYVYDLPTDFVRIIGEPLFTGASHHYSDGAFSDWRIRGRYFESAFIGPDILYVYKPISTELEDSDTDTYFSTTMDNSLRAVIQAMCKWKWCYHITGDLKATEFFRGEYLLTLKMAKAENLSNLKRVGVECNRLRYVKTLGVR